MNITATKTDTANVSVTAKIESADIEKNLNRMAKELAKTTTVDGFRKGKVPAYIVKKLHGEKLVQDAEGEILNKIIDMEDLK